MIPKSYSSLIRNKNITHDLQRCNIKQAAATPLVKESQDEIQNVTDTPFQNQLLWDSDAPISFHHGFLAQYTKLIMCGYPCLCLVKVPKAFTKKG